jgi:hypothetical protein
MESESQRKRTRGTPAEAVECGQALAAWVAEVRKGFGPGLAKPRTTCPVLHRWGLHLTVLGFLAMLGALTAIKTQATDPRERENLASWITLAAALGAGTVAIVHSERRRRHDQVARVRGECLALQRDLIQTTSAWEDRSGPKWGGTALHLAQRWGEALFPLRDGGLLPEARIPTDSLAKAFSCLLALDSCDERLALACDISEVVGLTAELLRARWL